MDGQGRLTELLAAADRGDLAAREHLLRVVYDDLHAVAAGQLKQEGAVDRLDATTLVHEAYLRLFGNGSAAWANRTAFLRRGGECDAPHPRGLRTY